MIKRKCLFVGNKTFLKKEFNDLLKEGKHKITLLSKSDKNYEIDKKKGKFCIRRK